MTLIPHCSAPGNLLTAGDGLGGGWEGGGTGGSTGGGEGEGTGEGDGEGDGTGEGDGEETVSVETTGGGEGATTGVSSLTMVTVFTQASTPKSFSTCE